MRKIARIAFERGTGARGLRSVVEKVLEEVLFNAEDGVRYVITEKTVKGGETVRQIMNQARTPLARICGVGNAPERRTWTNGHRALLYRFRRGSSAIMGNVLNVVANHTRQ